VESNLSIKTTNTPKFNVKTVSSAVFGKEDSAGGGSGESLKNIHKTLSKLSGHIRKSLVRIKALEFNLSKITPKLEEVEKKVIVNAEKRIEVEKKVIVNAEKITKIKNIIKTQKSNIGEKLPGSNKDDLTKSLIETNQILVQIQKELMRSSALRSQGGRGETDREKRSASKAKLNKEESQLEKSSKKIQKSVGEKSNETLAPVKGIFGRIMDFIGTLALGIAANAIFEWLKNPENMEKVKGWFSWIRENWGWAAAAVGAIALFPLIGAIGGLIGSLGLMMPLFAAAVPFLAKALLIAGAAVLAWKGLEAGFKAARNQLTGGTQFSAAHDILDKKLKDAGLDKDGKKRSKGASWDFLGWAGTRKEEKMTSEEQAISQEVLSKRKELNTMRDDMRGEIRNKHRSMDNDSGLSGMSSNEDVGKHNQTKSEAEKEIRTKYSDKISKIVPIDFKIDTTKVEARAKGGTVSAGTPYLVGERGPELFSPNIDGSIVNNMRTEKIYNMITSRKRGRGGVNITTLPTIANQLPPPEMPDMGVGEGATEVPEIASVNMSNPYRQLTPMLYGITV
jgi:hypothetical protein